jgi:hypothetical protein
MPTCFRLNRRWLTHAYSRRRTVERSLTSTVRQLYDRGATVTYVIEDMGGTSAGIKRIEEPMSAKESALQRSMSLVNYLLPKGFPHSVRAGYKQFATGQFVSNGLSTAAGVLSMQALLYALGIGIGTAGIGSASLAATLNWVIKDGLGQLGGVLFASVVNNKFDADPKRWRLLATIAMDAASFLEMLTPMMPGYFLAVASVANVGKNISFLAASASRAAIHRSFTLQENLADVTAKTGSQFIVSSLLGTSLGVTLSSFVAWSVEGAGAQYDTTLALYCALSSVSIAVTYWSLRHVTITSLGPARLDYVVHQYLFPLLHSGTSSEQYASSVEEGDLTSPEELRSQESRLGVPGLQGRRQQGNQALEPMHLPELKVGCDLHEAVGGSQEFQVCKRAACR